MKRNQDTHPDAEKRQKLNHQTSEDLSHYINTALFGAIQMHPAFDTTQWRTLQEVPKDILTVQTVCLTTHPIFWSGQTEGLMQTAYEAIIFVQRRTLLQGQKAEDTAAFIAMQNCYLSMLEFCTDHIADYLRNTDPLLTNLADWAAFNATEAERMLHTYTLVQNKWTNQKGDQGLKAKVSAIMLLPFPADVNRLLACCIIQLDEQEAHHRQTSWLGQASPDIKTSVTDARQLLTRYYKREQQSQ